MKSSVAFVCALFTARVLVCAQDGAPATGAPAAPVPPPAAPPIYPAVTAPAPVPQVYLYDQKPVSGRPFLVSPEQAQSIITRFKEEYKKLGNPRFVIYVNRELIDENSGMKLTSHKRSLEARKDPAAANGLVTQERVASTNIYRVRDRQEASLADKQTMRDVERLFGRPLRMAGVLLADQRLASQITGASPVDSFSVVPESEQARRDREALAKVADVALEILVSSKDATVAELAGDRTYTVPDIQATAIRLSDSRILGQATAADLIGQGASAGRAMRNFGVREIAEATALSLMEDIMLQ